MPSLTIIRNRGFVGRDRTSPLLCVSWFYLPSHTHERFMSVWKTFTHLLQSIWFERSDSAHISLLNHPTTILRWSSHQTDFVGFMNTALDSVRYGQRHKGFVVNPLIQFGSWSLQLAQVGYVPRGVVVRPGRNNFVWVYTYPVCTFRQ